MRELTTSDHIRVHWRLPSGEEITAGGRFTGLSVLDDGRVCIEWVDEFENDEDGELDAPGSVLLDWVTRVEVVERS
jgi:hypothetical protein